MARSALALRKGMSAEYLAKAHFSKIGYLILSPDSHETNYDFIISRTNDLLKVQVKSVIELKAFSLARIRNKHGATNKPYAIKDYDILAGVWVERNKIYLFRSADINENQYGEALTISKLNNTSLSNHKRPLPYFEGDI